jgi:hypothetical protein
MKADQSAMLPEMTHDDAARLAFVGSLRAFLSGSVMPGNYEIYERVVAPAVAGKTGAPPADRHEIRQLMTQVPYYQAWSALLRRSQEMMWDCGVDVTERQLAQLIERYRALRDAPGPGSLRLDPGLAIPAYHTAVDIHIQPGGYHTEQTGTDDVAAGAIFETGIRAYGWGINLGEALVEHVRAHWPDLAPARILDMGCTIGTSTLPWARAFPRAEVHAIDVAAPALRAWPRALARRSG